MRRFETCVCSTLHLPASERRFVEELIAARGSGRSIISRPDLTIVAHHDGYMVHTGMIDDHAERPASVPPALWWLLGRAFDEAATWLSFDREEPPESGLPVYPDDPPPEPSRPAIAIRCRTCGGSDVMRDAWARWDAGAQAWTLGSVFDAAFCNACETDTTLVEASLAVSLAERDMISPVDTPETDSGIRIMLSSIELSLLVYAALDPAALPMIRVRQRLNTIDADYSGIPRHAVPLDAWPEPLWRALAGTIVGLGEPAASQADVAILYAARIVADPVDRAA